MNFLNFLTDDTTVIYQLYFNLRCLFFSFEGQEPVCICLIWNQYFKEECINNKTIL